MNFTDAIIIAASIPVAWLLGKFIFLFMAPVKEPKQPPVKPSPEFEIQKFDTRPGAINYYEPQKGAMDIILAHPIGSTVKLSNSEIVEMYRSTEVTSADWNELRALATGHIDNICGRRIVRA